MTYILLSIIALLLAVIVVMTVKWPKVIELTDIAPKDNSPKNNWLQLQNEGGRYVRVENGRIKLKIVKWRE